MKQFFSETRSYINRNIKSLILFEILNKSLFLIVAIPFFSWSLQKLLRFAGYSYLTIDNISSFLRSPSTIIYGIVLLLLLSFFITLEIVSLIIYCLSCIQYRKIGIGQIVFPSIQKTFQIFRKRKNILLPFFCLMEVTVIGLPMLYNFFKNMRIPSYILNSALRYKGVVFCILLILATALFITFRGIFSIHFCVLENISLKEGFKKSKLLAKSHNAQILKYLFFWNLILIIGYVLLYTLVVLITGVFVYVSSEPSVVVVVFLQLLDQLNRYIMLFISITTIIANYGIITKLFITYKENNELLGTDIIQLQNKIYIANEEIKQGSFFPRKRWFTKRGFYFQSIIIVSFVAVFFNVLYVITGFYKSAFIETGSLFGTYVTAHRGASKNAPENTMEALERAIDLLADYAEIDVQETKDGIVVLMHDSSLKRTLGVNKKIWDVTYEELMGYDAGRWFSKEYEGTKVPTLAEVLDYCRGKIKLNIEMKVTSHEQNLAEKVVALIAEYDFERQCVITSTNYSALARVKEANESIKTGYILSLAYGYFYDNEYADFFSVKSSLIDESLVRMAHSLGKEVHAWTIKSRTEAKRMKQLGVDNIITDDPLMAREIIFSESSVANFKELLETLLKED